MVDVDRPKTTRYTDETRTTTSDSKSNVQPAVSRPCIFSGDASRPFWLELNSFKGVGNVKKQDLWSFLYSLGCRLQELESRLNNLGG